MKSFNFQAVALLITILTSNIYANAATDSAEWPEAVTDKGARVQYVDGVKLSSDKDLTSNFVRIDSGDSLRLNPELSSAGLFIGGALKDVLCIKRKLNITAPKSWQAFEVAVQLENEQDTSDTDVLAKTYIAAVHGRSNIVRIYHGVVNQRVSDVFFTGSLVGPEPGRMSGKLLVEYTPAGEVKSFLSRSQAYDPKSQSIIEYASFYFGGDSAKAFKAQFMPSWIDQYLLEEKFSAPQKRGASSSIKK